MISYSVIGYVDKLIGSPPDAKAQHAFPMGTDVTFGDCITNYLR